jgi:hypothetical protein
MRKVLLGLGWGFVFLAAGYDAYYAWQHRIVLQEWELNPFARWGARELGLPAVFAVKFAGLAFAAWVAAFCVRRQRRLGEPLTLATVCVYAALSWHYLADQKVLPRPGSVSKPIVPPCASTMLLQIASPSPCPPEARERALSTR